MSTGYQIVDQSSTYFLTFQVIDWVDVFTRKIYCDLIIESFDYCRRKKGLEIWAYVIMTNHVHCILSAKFENLSDVIRDFKSFTAKSILEMIDNPRESRRAWMLDRFRKAASKHERNSKLQFWTHENHAVELITHEFTCQKMAYIHENPMRIGWVEKAEDWLYSSQRNYSGLPSVLEIDVMDI